MSLRLSWYRLLVCGSLALAPLVVAAVQPLTAQDSLPDVPLSMMCEIGCIAWDVAVSPDGAAIGETANTSGHGVSFTVQNRGYGDDSYNLTCTTTGSVTCTSIKLNGVPVTQVVLDAEASATIAVGYSVGAAGSGTLKLTADGRDDDHGTFNITVIALPTVTLAASDTGATRVVHNRQPIIRARFLRSAGSPIDTARTRLVWRGDTVTALARHNRGLIEWEVDSTRWLRAGLPGQAAADTAGLVVIACDTIGACTTVTQSVILPNDNAPVLGFTGMPLGTVNGGFSAPFGPGFSVQGADIQTGFSIPSYISMGAARSAGLVYSTRTSYPRALVHVDLDLRWPTTTPSSVKLILSEGALKLDSLVLSSPASACLTGTIRRCRATLQGRFTGANPSPVMRKWLTVEARVTSGGVTKTSTELVEVVVVDRRASHYGSGWWLSGQSVLVAADGDRILVGPTGGAVIYRGHGDSVFVPPPGSVTALVKVVSGGDSTLELRPRGSLAKVIYRADGRLRAAVDASGNRDSLVYSGSTEQVTALRDPVGKSITLAYASGKLSTITDPGGRQSTVTISATTNQLTRRWLASPSARPDTVRFSYDTVTSSATVLVRQRQGVLPGDTTAIIYDGTAFRRPLAVRLPPVQNETGAIVYPQISYTAYERQGYGALRSLDSVYVEMKDPRNNWTRSLLNRWSQSLRSWDAMGLLGRAAYDADGFALWGEGRNGDSSRVTYVYDALHRPVTSYVTRAGGAVLRGDSVVYDANHRVVQQIDNRGKVTTTTYDGLGRVTQIVAPYGTSGQTTKFWYRTDGLLDSTRHDGHAKSSRTIYDDTWKNVLYAMDAELDTLFINTLDSYGRTIRTERRQAIETAAATTKWQWTRNDTWLTVGNQADSVATQLSQAKTSKAWSPTYAAADTVNSQRVRHLYDRAGRDTARVNNRGKATTYRYDLLGRVVARWPWADSASVRDSMAYDVAGNVKKSFSRRGTTITHHFDTRNRDTLTAIPGVGDLRRTYGGPHGQLTRLWYVNAVDSIGGVNGELRWRYDGWGRLVADTSYTGSTVRLATVAYDAFDRPVTSTDALGTWTTAYDTVTGLPAVMTTPMGDTLSLSRDAHFRASTLAVRSQALRQDRSRIFGGNETLRDASTTVHSATGSYDPGSWHRRTDDVGPLALTPSWQQQLGEGAASETLVDSTRMDGWGRLVRWAGFRDGVLQLAEDYSFDATGNIDRPTGVANYHGITDRLLGRVNGAGRDSLRYDRAGNLVQFREASGGPVWDYGYDALERLVSVRRNGTLIARYGYDLLGRRVVKRVYSSASGGTVGYLRFVYRGDQVGFETDSGGTIGLKYTYGGTDELLAITDGAVHYYVTTDRLGSVRALSRRDGSWALTQRFAPYGERIARDTSASFGLGGRLRYDWTGREYDSETGFSFHRARYYLRTLRRWTQEDPIGYRGGINLYAYVGGTPLEGRDPSGLRKEWHAPNTFCTRAGNCVNADGSVTRPGWDRFWGGSGGGGDGNGNGRDDLGEFADYAFGRQMWRGTDAQWRAIQWALDHGMDQGVADRIRRELMFRRVRPVDLEIHRGKGDEPLVAEGKGDSTFAVTELGYMYINTVGELADLQWRNSSELAYTLAHEYAHVLQGSPTPSCAVERQAYRYATQATGNDPQGVYWMSYNTMREIGYC